MTPTTDCPFNQTAELIAADWIVTPGETSWVIRCKFCSAGWMIQRPTEGIAVNPFDYWPALLHQLTHRMPEARQLNGGVR